MNCIHTILFSVIMNAKESNVLDIADSDGQTVDKEESIKADLSKYKTNETNTTNEKETKNTEIFSDPGLLVWNLLSWDSHFYQVLFHKTINYPCSCGHIICHSGAPSSPLQSQCLNSILKDRLDVILSLYPRQVFSVCNHSHVVEATLGNLYVPIHPRRF